MSLSSRVAALPLWHHPNPADQGVFVREGVPGEVLEAVHRIANETQHQFVNTWLPRLIENDERPLTGDKEHDALVDVILKYRDQCIQTDRPLDADEQKKLEALRRKFASSILQSQVYNAQSEGAGKIFKGVLAAALAGFGLSIFAPNFVHLGEASIDDVGNLAGIVKGDRAKGHPLKEIAKSQIPAGAALLTVPSLTLGINGAIQSGAADVSLLGAQYGIAASLVSLAGLAGTWLLMSKNYSALAKDSKAELPRGKWKKVKLFFKSVKEGGKQSWKSPAAPGLMIGAAAAVGAGALLGPLHLAGSSGVLLQNPLFLAAVGVMETVGAVVSTSLHQQISNLRLSRQMRKIAA